MRCSQSQTKWEPWLCSDDSIKSFIWPSASWFLIWKLDERKIDTVVCQWKQIDNNKIIMITASESSNCCYFQENEELQIGVIRFYARIGISFTVIVGDHKIWCRDSIGRISHYYLAFTLSYSYQWNKQLNLFSLFVMEHTRDSDSISKYIYLWMDGIWCFSGVKGLG